MIDGYDGADGRVRQAAVRRDTIGLALIVLVAVLSLFIAVLIALPAWDVLNEPAAPPTPTVEAVGMVTVARPAEAFPDV